jgi:hypothetical protein
MMNSLTPVNTDAACALASALASATHASTFVVWQQGTVHWGWKVMSWYLRWIDNE